jgi:hypothetical protein
MSTPNYRAFAHAIIDASWMDAEVEGDVIQQLAEDCGIIQKTKYDPAIHGDVGREFADPGDDWFEYVPDDPNPMPPRPNGERRDLIIAFAIIVGLFVLMIGAFLIVGAK